MTPMGVALDAAGNLYISDERGARIREVSPAGVITTIAGNGEGPNLGIIYNSGVAVDSFGNVFISDLENNLIRTVTPSGIVTTIAGTGVPGYSGDGGPAANAQLQFPYGVAVDRSGNVYVGDTANNAVGLLTPSKAPTPSLSSLSPNSAIAGGAGFTMIATGSGFLNGSTAVEWNGSALSTTFASGTQLTASVPASLISAPSSASITVVTLGGTSNALTFPIFSACDLQQNGNINVADVQVVINEALGAMQPSSDLNGDGMVNVVDVQIVINAVLGLSCTT
jgi:hypothetical protein